MTCRTDEKAPLICLLLFLLATSSFLQAQNPSVLLIGIDDCRPNALSAAHTPHIDDLKSNGLYSPNALNDDIPITGPGWAAALSGVRSDNHLVTNNAFIPNDYANYLMIFKRIEDHYSVLHTVSFVQWKQINDLIVLNHADHKLYVETATDLAGSTALYLVNHNPDMLFLYFVGVDDAGHSHGFSPQIPEYIAAIEAVDTLIGIVVDSLKARPNFANEDWLIMLTTDHGGIGTEHNGFSIED